MYISSRALLLFLEAFLTRKAAEVPLLNRNHYGHLHSLERGSSQMDSTAVSFVADVARYRTA